METVILSERQIFACKETNCEDYQTYSECCSALGNYLYSHTKDDSKTYILGFVFDTVDKEKYIAVFRINYSFNDIAKRYIIHPGHRLSEADEELLLNDLDSDVVCDNYDDLLADVRKAFPEWGLDNVDYGSVKDLLEHCYYASFPGPKGILAKNQLLVIGRNINHIPSYNLMGKSPEEILGRNLSKHMLRVLNDKNMVSCLYNDQSIKRFIKIYNQFSGIIQDKISPCQYLYLDHISDAQNQIEEFKEGLYRYLGDYGNEDLMQKYDRFYCVRSKVKMKSFISTPMPGKLDEVIERLQIIQNYQKNIELVDGIIKKHNNERNWVYGDDVYIVLKVTGGVQEIIDEAVTQSNDGLIYAIDDYVNGNTTILLLRQLSQINIPYVSCIVRDDYIESVYDKYARLPCVRVLKFLERYSRAMGIKYSPWEIVTRAIEEVDVFSYSEKEMSELIEYADCNKNEEP